MFKKTILSVLVLTILMTVVPAMAISETETRRAPMLEQYSSLSASEITNTAKKFSDITTHYGKDFIARMSAVGIIAGYGNGKFGPNDTLIACQFITMVVRSLGFKPEVPSNTPYWKPYVDIAIQQGLVKTGEISDYTGKLSREMAAVIAVRALLKYEESPTGTDLYYDYNVAKMSDFSKITEKYKNDVVLSYRLGLITGSNNIFEPKGTLTRAQGAIIVNKLIDKNIRIESKPQVAEKFAAPDAEFEKFMKSSEASKYVNLDTISEVTGGKIYFNTTRFIKSSHPKYSERILVPNNSNPEINKEVYEVVRGLVANAKKYGGYVSVIYNPSDVINLVSIQYFTSKAAGEKYKYEYGHCAFNLNLFIEAKRDYWVDQKYPGEQKEKHLYQWELGGLCSPQFLFEQGLVYGDANYKPTDLLKYNLFEDSYVNTLQDMFISIYGETQGKNVMAFYKEQYKKDLQGAAKIIGYRSDFGGCEMVFIYNQEGLPFFTTSKVGVKK